jgi:signal transduction histidine kinase
VTLLFWRMVAPVLLVSTLLTFIGASAAWYLQRMNARVSDALDHYLSAVIACEELVSTIRDTETNLDLHGATDDPAYFDAALANRPRLDQLLQQLQAVNEPRPAELAARISTAARQFFDGLEESRNSSSVDSEAIRSESRNQVLIPARELLRQNLALASQQSRRNQDVANRLGAGFLVLGSCGAAGGLLAGFGIARSVTRSLQQIGGSVHSLVGSLSDAGGDARRPSPPDLPELHSTMLELADRTANFVQELHETRQLAERSDQLAAVGQLAAGLAHELRNPLTSVKLLVQSAQEANLGLSDRDLLVLDEEVRRLECLVQTFLDFARPPQPCKKPVEVRELIQQSAEFVRPRAESHGVQISSPGVLSTTVIEGDAQQLRQVLLNVLLNAIDAQPQGGRIDIRLDEEEVDSRPMAVIDITDRGSGLPTQLGPRIFEPFISTKEAGMGLGLSICKRIVESHGGTIVAESPPEGGAAFQIRLPAHCQ